MTTINISDLHPTGTELFSDSESYMNELGDSEISNIQGGLTTPVCASITVSILVSQAAAPLIYDTVKGERKTGGGGGGRVQAV